MPPTTIVRADEAPVVGAIGPTSLIEELNRRLSIPWTPREVENGRILQPLTVDPCQTMEAKGLLKEAGWMLGEHVGVDGVANTWTIVRWPAEVLP